MQGFTGTTRHRVTKKGEEKDENDIRELFRKSQEKKGSYVL